MIKNKYTYSKFSIEPNYGNEWEITKDNAKHMDFIMIAENPDDICISANLSEAIFIRDTLDIIIKYYQEK